MLKRLKYNRKILKNSKFFFGLNSVAYLSLIMKPSNFFLILLDYNKKVMSVKSSGCAKLGNLRRKNYLIML